MREIGQGFLRIITNWRLLILILIITGFWMVQQQLYATMPKYVIRMAGETAKPGWIANVNPFVVVCCVSFVTRLMAKRSAITSMNIGMFLIPFSALLMACGNLLGNDVISGMSNITLMMIAGIVIQALAECFISPRYLEYFSLQAPKGEEGMYLGFSHLHSFLSSIFGFGKYQQCQCRYQTDSGEIVPDIMRIGAGSLPCFTSLKEDRIGTVFCQQYSGDTKTENGRKEGMEMAKSKIHTFFTLRRRKKYA